MKVFASILIVAVAGLTLKLGGYYCMLTILAAISLILLWRK